ncbi:MAG: ankyrin repeat domain-containing protein, partial [Elusimicrobia bacterium]|nr:ankyrin repeat domain-containing protein [Elusimicrobiota bacterium]
MNFKFLDGKTNEEIKFYINENIDNKKEISFYLAEKGNLELIKYLIKEKKLDVNSKSYFHNKTVLSSSCKSGNIDLVKYLIKHGADVNVKNKYGQTILFSACESGNLELVKYLVEEKNLAVNVKNKYGQTILFSACESGNLEIL